MRASPEKIHSESHIADWGSICGREQGMNDLLGGLTHKKLSTIFFRKHLKGINGQMLGSKGIIRVVPKAQQSIPGFPHLSISWKVTLLLDLSANRASCQLHHDRSVLQLRVDKGNILIGLTRSVNLALHDQWKLSWRLERDPSEESTQLSYISWRFLSSLSSKRQNRAILAQHGEGTTASSTRVKTAATWIDRCFLHNNRSTPVIISENWQRMRLGSCKSLREISVRFQIFSTDWTGIIPNTHRVALNRTNSHLAERCDEGGSQRNFDLPPPVPRPSADNCWSMQCTGNILEIYDGSLLCLLTSSGTSFVDEFSVSPKMGELSEKVLCDMSIRPPSYNLLIGFFRSRSCATLATTQSGQSWINARNIIIWSIDQNSTTEKELSNGFCHWQVQTLLGRCQSDSTHGPCYTKISPDQEGRQATTRPLDSCSFKNSQIKKGREQGNEWHIISKDIRIIIWDDTLSRAILQIWIYTLREKEFIHLNRFHLRDFLRTGLLHRYNHHVMRPARLFVLRRRVLRIALTVKGTHSVFPLLS